MTGRRDRLSSRRRNERERDTSGELASVRERDRETKREREKERGILGEGGSKRRGCIALYSVS